MEQAVTTRNLWKQFGDTTALNDVNLNIPKGVSLGLAGPNGSGKSTLLKVLLGLYPKSGGEAEVLGYSIGKDSHNIRQHVGYLPDKLPFSWERVSPLIRGFAYLQGSSFASARKAAAAALEEYDMQEYGEKRYRELSEGMKKRILLALATVHNPDVFFLDEPTANLDVLCRQKVEEMIRRQTKQGKTLLLVTHRARQIQRLCSRIAVLIHARLVFEGNIPEFMNRMNREEMIIPNQGLEHVKLEPADIDRFQLKSLGRFTIVPGEHWSEFLRVSNIDPEKVDARQAPRELGYALAKCYAYGVEGAKPTQ